MQNYFKVLCINYNLENVKVCHCEPVTDVTGVAIRSLSGFPFGEGKGYQGLSGFQA